MTVFTCSMCCSTRICRSLRLSTVKSTIYSQMSIKDLKQSVHVMQQHRNNKKLLKPFQNILEELYARSASQPCLPFQVLLQTCSAHLVWNDSAPYFWNKKTQQRLSSRVTADPEDVFGRISLTMDENVSPVSGRMVTWTNKMRIRANNVTMREF